MAEVTLNMHFQSSCAFYVGRDAGLDVGRDGGPVAGYVALLVLVLGFVALVIICLNRSADTVQHLRFNIYSSSFQDSTRSVSTGTVRISSGSSVSVPSSSIMGLPPDSGTSSTATVRIARIAKPRPPERPSSLELPLSGEVIFTDS